MKTVMRGNKQLRVADERVADFERLGYTEIDETTGKPLRPPEPRGEKALKKENAALKETNKQLEEQIKALSEELEALKTPKA